MRIEVGLGDLLILQADHAPLAILLFNIDSVAVDSEQDTGKCFPQLAAAIRIELFKGLDLNGLAGKTLVILRLLKGPIQSGR